MIGAAPCKCTIGCWQPLANLLQGVFVLYPGKGVCADPVNEGAILGRGGPSPHSRDRERQLAPDIGRGET
jgi:hypothetical protein